VSGLKQATGEAVYIDDMPRFEHEVYLALVLSSKAHAKILSIDPTEALKLDGVLDFISAKVSEVYEIMIKDAEIHYSKFSFSFGSLGYPGRTAICRRSDSR